MDINLPAEFGGGSASIMVCMVCGLPPAAEPKPPGGDTAHAVAGLLHQVDLAAEAGASEAEIALLLTRGQFEAGVVYGSLRTARKMVERVTFKGRLRRLRALWPLNTEEKKQEAEDLLLMGDQHHGS